MIEHRLRAAELPARSSEMRRAAATEIPEVSRRFANFALTDRQQAYLDFNTPRYAFLLETCRRILHSDAEGGSGVRILDVGPSFQTALIRAAWPEATVDSLGFADPAFEPREHESHWSYDLNDAIDPTSWPSLEPYDLIVMGEVIEHLYTAAVQVLRGLRTMMRPAGSLVIQTPNAAALHKRLQMLVGRHPFGEISEDRSDPLHFREYLPSELADAGRRVGLTPVRIYLENYFSRDSTASSLYNAVSQVLPPSFRAGITVVFIAAADTPAP